MPTGPAPDLEVVETLSALLAQGLAAGAAQLLLMPGERPLMRVGSPPAPGALQTAADLIRMPGHGKVKLVWLRALIAAVLPESLEASGETRRGEVTLAGQRWQVEAVTANRSAAVSLSLVPSGEGDRSA